MLNIQHYFEVNLHKTISKQYTWVQTFDSTFWTNSCRCRCNYTGIILKKCPKTVPSLT